MNDHTKLPQKPQGHPVDEGRPLRVAIIGGGVSGIAVYIRLLQYVPNCTITIFEKNSGLGGTWFENRYPGVACDIPSHVYQYSFEPNPRWSKFFSEGSEILEYIQSVGAKYGVADKIKYNTRVTAASWDDQTGTWAVKTEHTEDSGKVQAIETTAEIVISAVGILNNWKWPDIDGLHSFKGALLHSANWDTSWDYTGKTVALLGCGSSAIQILPLLQKKCPRVFNFIRGGTWISQPFGSTLTEAVLANSTEPGNYRYTESEKSRFLDKEYYQTYRREMESFINKDFPSLVSGSVEAQECTDKIRKMMIEKLSSKPGLYEALEPTFSPGCRRLTPGPGYLEALVNDNVELVKTPIIRVQDDCVITLDGKKWKVDAIACATGFDSSHMPRFPIIGQHGQTLADRYSQRTAAYLSHSVPGFPNYFFVGGPNSATGGGSLLLILESVINHVVKMVQKVSREHIKSMEVKESALEVWTKHLDNYFPTTVHVDSCTSWYKVNGKIVGLWPGSSVHAMKTLEHHRWEDYDYQFVDPSPSWVGNGWTVEDVNRGDLGYYIDHVDLPPIPSKEALAMQP